MRKLAEQTYEEQVRASIERGLADIEAGRVHSTEEVRAYLEDQRRRRVEGKR